MHGRKTGGYVQPRFGGSEGRPWSERKKYIWWDEAQRQLDGSGCAGLRTDKDAVYRPPPDDTGMAAISGDAPFIMKPDGRGWLFAPTGVKDGPLPAHYEPMESPVANLLYRAAATIRRSNCMTCR